jgi:hypothetical protein
MKVLEFYIFSLLRNIDYIVKDGVLKMDKKEWDLDETGFYGEENDRIDSEFIDDKFSMDEKDMLVKLINTRICEGGRKIEIDELNKLRKKVIELIYV